MSGVYYEFEEVDTFTTGAVGRPGARTFFLQARQGRTRVAVSAQVEASATPPVPTPAVATPAQEAAKPPQSWKPLAREKWATLAPDIQQEVLRREKETASALQ